ncbi:MAG: T9SS type A sorting domain-containing protein [Bacteroidota bacterium]
MRRFILGFSLLLGTCFPLWSQPVTDLLSPQEVYLSLPPAAPEVIRAVKAAYPWLDQQQNGLRLISQRETAAGWVLNFSQEFQDLPIHEGQIKLLIDAQGKIRRLIPHLHRYPLSSVPPFSQNESLLKTRLAVQESAEEVVGAKVWLADDKGLHPAYRMHTFSQGGSESWEVLLDGITGQELGRHNRVSHLHHASAMADTSGRARVFNPNPCKVAGVGYGELFADSADYHDPIFENFIDTVTLTHLTFENGQFRLKGPYIRLEERGGPQAAPVSSPSGDFFFNRDTSGFEDVMVYYHIHQMIAYLDSLGYPNIHQSVLPIDPHGFTGDNSAFVTNSGNPYLLYGIGFVDDAEDADVILHEYIHAVSYFVAPETNAGIQRGGLDEGFGDYFTAIYSKDKGLADWATLFNWDGHNAAFGGWNGRIANTTQLFDPSELNIYKLGAVWCSALIHAREEVGATTMDKLVVENMYQMQINLSMESAARLLLLADTLTNASANSEALHRAFCDQGILPLSDPMCAVVSLPSELPKSVSLLLFPNPNEGSFQLQWEGWDFPEAPTLELFNSQGQLIRRMDQLQGQDFQTQLNLSRGLYLLRFGHENRGWHTEKMLVQP